MIDSTNQTPTEFYGFKAENLFLTNSSDIGN